MSVGGKHYKYRWSKASMKKGYLLELVGGGELKFQAHCAYLEIITLLSLGYVFAE